MKKNGAQSTERRRAKRLPVLDSFSVALVLPKKGDTRLTVFDVSRLGIGFYLDENLVNLPSDLQAEYQLHLGGVVEAHLYLNQSLYIPVSVTVARLEEQDQRQRVGVEFVDLQSPGFLAFESFVQMLDRLGETGKIIPR